MLTLQDQIWNRACLESGGDYPREGDIALSALLLVHGMVMNGGVLHAAEAVPPQELVAAIAGFKYFGLTGAASVLELAPSATAASESSLNSRYWSAVPDDSVIHRAFLAKQSVSPELFAPVASSQNA